MELYKRVIEIVDANLIFCLIPIILTLLLIEVFFKNRFETKKALNLVRWIIIVYSFITWTITLIGIILNPEESAFVNRAIGLYGVIYWIMFLSALILPFTLLNKKLASNFWYVLMVAFAMKFGMYFERFVIIVISFHRDYLNENGSTKLIDLFSFGFGIIFLQGVIITFLFLGIFEIIKRKQERDNDVYS